MKTYKIVMDCGSQQLTIGRGLTYDKAFDICDSYNWTMQDDEHNVWDLYIREEQDESRL